MDKKFFVPPMNNIYWTILFFVVILPSVIFRRKPAKPSSAVKNILVVRLDHIGDLFMTVPFFASLRKTYPGAKITLLCNKANTGLINRTSYIDEYLDYSPFWLSNEWLKSRSLLSRFAVMTKGLMQYFAMIGLVKKRNFDIAFEPRGDFFSAMIVYFVCRNERVGFSNIGGKYLFTRSVPFSADKHWMEAPLELIRAVGGEVGQVRYELMINDRDREHVGGLFRRNNIGPDDSVVAIHPGVNNKRRNWDIDKFAKLADRIIDKFHAKVVFLGAAFDKNKIESITGKMRNKTVSLAGATSLYEMAEVIRRSGLFVGLESSGMHIAAAVGTTSVIVYGGLTDPRQFGPYNSKAYIVRKEMECLDCFGRKKCRTECISSITVDDVMEKVDLAFKNQKQ